MINAAHLIISSRDADADRAFLRDVLRFPHVDAGHDWLIFALPPAELAVHPGDSPSEPGTQLYLMCDDLAATVEELSGRGVRFIGPVSPQSWGALMRLRLPGGGEIGLYQPSHPMAATPAPAAPPVTPTGDAQPRSR